VRTAREGRVHFSDLKYLVSTTSHRDRACAKGLGVSDLSVRYGLPSISVAAFYPKLISKTDLPDLPLVALGRFWHCCEIAARLNYTALYL